MIRIDFKEFIKNDSKEILKYYNSSNKKYILNLLDLYEITILDNKKEMKEILKKELEKEFNIFKNKINEEYNYKEIDDFFYKKDLKNIEKNWRYIEFEYKMMKEKILELELENEKLQNEFNKENDIPF